MITHRGREFALYIENELIFKYDRRVIRMETTQSEQMQSAIQSLAYKLFEERCDQDAEGDEISDWLTAEQLVQEDTRP